MKATFVGIKKPYTSAKNGKTYFGGYFTTPNREDSSCVELLELDMTGVLHARLIGTEPGQELDIDVMPRMFAGKPQGLDLIAING